MRHSFGQDLFWALYIFFLAAGFGILQHWHLVSLASRGELPVFLTKLRQDQRQVLMQGVKTVTLEQAHKIWERGEALFLDARPPDEFQEQHVPGALNLQPEKLAESGPAALAGIPKDRQIVVYCDQESCNLALQMAAKLQSLGFSNVTAFLGGFRAWDEAGHPTATGR
jgi:rhodanese-related sulfurtransferase